VHKPPNVDPIIIAQVLAECEAELGVSLSRLMERFSSDDLLTLIAQGTLYVDLKRAPLSEPDRVQVFASKEIAEAVFVLSNKAIVRDTGVSPVSGDDVLWNGTCWTVGPVAKDFITLLPQSSGNPIELRYDLFTEYVRQGKILSVNAPREFLADEEVRKILLSATKDDFIIANARLDAIEYYIAEKKLRIAIRIFPHGRGGIGSGCTNWLKSGSDMVISAFCRIQGGGKSGQDYHKSPGKLCLTLS
jgi:hypothetical protein